MELRFTSRQTKALQALLKSKMGRGGGGYVGARELPDFLQGAWIKLQIRLMETQDEESPRYDAVEAARVRRALKERKNWVFDAYAREAIAAQRTEYNQQRRVRTTAQFATTREGTEVDISDLRSGTSAVGLEAGQGQVLSALGAADIQAGDEAVALWEAPRTQNILDSYELQPGGLAKRIVVELHLGKPNVLPEQPPELTRPVRRLGEKREALALLLGEEKPKPARAVFDLVSYHFSDEQGQCPTCMRIARYLGRVRMKGGGRLTSREVSRMVDAYVSQIQS